MKGQKVELRLTLMVGSDYYGGTRLEIIDSASGIQFVEVKITAEQLANLLSRHADVRCEGMVSRHLDKVGKQRQTKPFIFEVAEWSSKDEAIVYD